MTFNNGLQKDGRKQSVALKQAIASDFEVVMNEPVAGHGRQIVASAKGLPVTFRDGVPELPPMTLTRRVSLVTKRMMDITFAGLGLIALSPLLLAIAALIRLTSPGPVLFKQVRGGFGKEIRVLKFRSMFADRGDPSGRQSTVAGDHRITPIGDFLRRTNIDELPQLINVLRGDMSLIGPRPHPIGIIAAGRPYEELVPYYDLRHAMRPGITGWAQANGLRGPTTNPDLATQRINCDLAYIQNFSLLLDLRIFFLTVAKEMLKSSGF